MNFAYYQEMNDEIWVTGNYSWDEKRVNFEVVTVEKDNILERTTLKITAENNWKETQKMRGYK